MFDLINRLLSFLSNLFESDPHQDRTADMVADNSGFPTLTTFQSGELLGFSVKLLNLPAQATHFLYGLRVVLSHIVGDDIIRALGRQHHPEQFHFVILGKALELHHFAMRSFQLRPVQPIHSLIRLHSTRIIHLAVILERAIIDLFQALHKQHDILGRIPAIHQDEPKQKFLLIHTVCQHIMHMIQLGLAIPVRIINALVDDPELVQHGIDIHTGHHPNSFDDPVCISAPLAPHQIHLEREILIHNRVIKHHISFRNLCHLSFHIFPYQVGRDFFACQIPVDRVMAEFLGVISKIGQRIIDLADQQILAIIQTSNGLFVSFHTFQTYSHSPILVKSSAYFA